MTHWILLISFLFFNSLCSEEKTLSEKGPEGFSLEITLPQTQISLLEELPLFVSLTFPDTYHINLENLRSRLLYHSFSPDAPFSLNSEIVLPLTTTSQHINIQKVVFILEPQYSGKHPLTFLVVSFEPNDPKTNPIVELTSPIVEVLVTPSSKGIKEPLDAPLMTFSMGFPIDLDADNRRAQIAPPYQSHILQVFKEREVPWLGIFSLVAALIFIFKFGKMQTDEDRERIKKHVDAKQKALQELSVLQKMIQDHQINLFYVGITHTLRSFIEDYYHVEAGSRTTEEFLNDRAAHPIFSSEMQEKLKSFLENADKVLYGLGQATQQDCLEALKMAYYLIQSSTQSNRHLA